MACFNHDGRMLTPDESAEYLGVKNASAVLRFAKQGLFAHYRVGRRYRFRQADLDEYLSKCRRLGKKQSR